MPRVAVVTDSTASLPAEVAQASDVLVTMVVRFAVSLADLRRTTLRLDAALGEQERLAVTDGLTGLYNRRYVQHLLVAQHERTSRDRGPLSLIALDLDRVDPPLDLGQGRDRLAERDRPNRLRLDIASAAVEPGEEVVHLLHRAVQGRDHVLAELGLVGVPLGIADDEAQLADQILDVVDDEGEAPVEFLEPLGVHQRLLPVRLRQ